MAQAHLWVTYNFLKLLYCNYKKHEMFWTHKWATLVKNFDPALVGLETMKRASAASAHVCASSKRPLWTLPILKKRIKAFSKILMLTLSCEAIKEPSLRAIDEIYRRMTKTNRIVLLNVPAILVAALWRSLIGHSLKSKLICGAPVCHSCFWIWRNWRLADSILLAQDFSTINARQHRNGLSFSENDKIWITFKLSLTAKASDSS